MATPIGFGVISGIVEKILKKIDELLNSIDVNQVNSPREQAMMTTTSEIIKNLSEAYKALIKSTKVD